MVRRLVAGLCETVIFRVSNGNLVTVVTVVTVLTVVTVVTIGTVVTVGTIESKKFCYNFFFS